MLQIQFNKIMAQDELYTFQGVGMLQINSKFVNYYGLVPACLYSILHEDFQNQDSPYIEFSYERIIELLNISSRSIRSHVKALQKLGFVQIHRLPGIKRNFYSTKSFSGS